MQTLGFAHALEPALRRLHSGGEALREATARHFSFFNTNPILASVILGCVVRLEEDDRGGSAEAVGEIKSALMGAYGGIGDSLFWGGIKPMFIIAALHAAYGGALWAPWLFLISFTAANLGARILGFWQGYRQGARVVEAIARMNPMAWASRLKTASALLLGTLLSGMAGPTLLREWGIPPAVWAPAALVIVLGLAWLIARGTRPEWFAYTGLFVSMGVVACS